VRCKRAVADGWVTVRINLSGLVVEHLLRAIMGIRALGLLRRETSKGHFFH
jgi:hypothetical protein